MLEPQALHGSSTSHFSLNLQGTSSKVIKTALQKVILAARGRSSGGMTEEEMRLERTCPTSLGKARRKGREPWVRARAGLCRSVRKNKCKWCSFSSLAVLKTKERLIFSRKLQGTLL